jgi:hypothetical protein
MGGENLPFSSCAQLKKNMIEVEMAGTLQAWSAGFP